MAINYELINKGGISLGTNFELLGEKPLDARLVVPSLDGLAHLIAEKAAYAGMIVYVTAENKHYQVNADGTYREFGITADELKALIASETTAAMEFKGAATALPANPAKGDMYKVTATFKVGEEDVKVGDSIVYDGAQWFIIPSGDDIEDTWRPVTDVDNDATLTFVAGDKLEKTVAADGTITYKHAAIDAPELLAENEQTRTYITEVETDGFGHITGYKTATENVVDTNTEYEFTSQVATSSVYFQVDDNKEGSDAKTIYVDAYSKNETDLELAKKVDKVEGYSLVADDEIARLAEVDNYDDEEVRGLIGDNAKAIEDLEKYVGTIPNNYTETNVISYINKKAQETLAAAQGGSSETAASVKQQLDDYKSENDTRVDGIEDAIDAINDTNNGILKQAKDYADGLAANYDEKGAAAGVETALDAKKVDKVEGKSLIADSEIARLATLHNYDDTQVKADIAKKADAEAMTTELGKKVDKVTGKSLVDDAEITKLAGISAGANKVEASANNGSIKIDGVETVVYTHPEKHAIADVTGLQDALDGKQAAGNYSAEGHKHVKADITDFAHTHTASEITDLDATIKAYDYATKTELGNVDAKFANYKTAADQKLIDDEQDRRLGVIEGDYLKAADIANFETKANVKKVADDLAAYVEANDAALAAETKARTDADAGFETRIAALEGNFGDGEGTVEAQIAAAVKVEEDARKAAVKGVQDEVDALEGRMDTAEGKITALETESAKHAVKTEVEAALALKADKSVVDAMYTNAQIDGFIAEAKKYADDNDADTKYGIVYDSENKKIKLVEGGTEVEIDATDFIKDGMIETVTIGDDNDLVITFNTAAGKENIVLPLDQLVDIYTGVEGARIKVTVASDKSISADLVAGSISKNYLDDGVQASLAKADSAEANAKAYADSLMTAANLAQYAKEADLKTLEGRVDGVREDLDIVDGEITVLKGADTVEGSVAKTVKDAIAAENLSQYAKNADLATIVNEVYGSSAITGESRIDALERDVEGQSQSIVDHNGRLGTAEQYIQDLTTDLNTLSGRVDVTEQDIKTLKGRVDGVREDLDIVDGEITVLNGADTVEGSVANKIKGAINSLVADLTGSGETEIVVKKAECATYDSQDNVIADTYAKKATTLAGYGITEQYYNARETEDAIRSLADGQVKANKEAIEKLNGDDSVSDSVANKIKHAIDGLITDLAGQGDREIMIAEAQHATMDGQGNIIYDTYAQKATTLAGYGIGDAYTKAEVETLLTWGEF